MIRRLLAHYGKHAALLDGPAMQIRCMGAAKSSLGKKTGHTFDENYEDEDEKFPSELNITSASTHQEANSPGLGFISFGATASGEP